eukprot:417931_1
MKLMSLAKATTSRMNGLCGGGVEKAFVSTLVVTASVELLNTLYKKRRKEDDEFRVGGDQLLRRSDSVNSGSAFGTDKLSSFRRNYLIVYCLATFCDSLQGGYIYKLYESKGLHLQAIARLYIVSAVSSVAAGLTAGGMMDKFGRRAACLAYCALNIMHCMAAHSRDMWVLVGGRVLSGMSSIILCTAFECWMVAEHHAKRFAPASISDTIVLQVKLSSGLSIIAGIVAAWLVHLSGNRVLAPFEFSAVIAMVSGMLAMTLWGENYGRVNSADSASGEGLLNDNDSGRLGIMRYFQDTKAYISGIWGTIKTPQVRALGLYQMLFEGSLLVLIFTWTPALIASAGGSQSLNMGLAFTSFMLALTAGSSVYQLALNAYGGSGEATAAIAARVLVATGVIGGGALFTASRRLPLLGTMACILIFEACIGAYYSAIGGLRAYLLPDSCRGGVYSIFMMGVNTIGVTMLLGPLGGLRGQGNLTTDNRHILGAFTLCAGMCLTASKIAFTSLSRSQLVNYK